MKITKKTAIKRFFTIFIGTILFAATFFILIYGKIPVKAFLIAIAIILPIMVLGTIVGYKNQKKITKKNKKFHYFHVALGILLIILGLIGLFTNEGDLNNYLKLGMGAIFLIYGIIKIK